MIHLDRIDHIVLRVRSIEDTCAFYTQVLGMKRIDIQGRTSLLFGQQKINLHEIGTKLSMDAANQKEWNTNICFISKTPIEEVKQLLDQSGIEILEGINEKNGALGKILSVYFQDPDGNLLEVSNYT